MTYCDFTDLAVDQCAHCGPQDPIAQIEREVVAELHRHGLTDWSFRWDRAKTRLGLCNHTRKVISLSLPWAEVRPREDTRTTILHEVAHAMVGPAHGHDEVWRRQAQALGIRGDRCSDVGEARIAKPVRGTCPRGHVVEQHRLPRRVQSCSSCSRFFNLNALFSWTREGKPAQMGQAYREEYRRLTGRSL